MLKVRIENLGQIAILHVAGHIVIGPEIEVLRKSALLQSGVRGVVLELRQVSRIDARGLGVLLELREQLHRTGVEFRLMNISHLVEQILRITCLDAVFEIAREEQIRSRDNRELVLEEAVR